MFKQDKFWLGIALGAAIPIVGYAFFLTVDEWVQETGVLDGRMNYSGFDTGFWVLMGIMLNLIPFQYYKKIRYDESLRGLVPPTFVYCMIWLFKWGIYPAM